MTLVDTPVLEVPPVRLRPFRYHGVPLVLSAGADPDITGGTSVPASGGETEARA